MSAPDQAVRLLVYSGITPSAVCGIWFSASKAKEKLDIYWKAQLPS